MSNSAMYPGPYAEPDITRMLHQHQLSIGPVNGECSYCGCMINGQRSVMCFYCPIVMCFNCAFESLRAESPYVHHQHEMFMRIRTEGIGWMCDCCKRKFTNREGTFNCPFCDFDICKTCYCKGQY